MKHLPHSVSGTMDNANRIHDYGFFLGNDSVDIADKIDLAHAVMYDVCDGWHD